MKWIVIAWLAFGSSAVYAACEAGQMTTLTAPSEFYRMEASGNRLAVTLKAGHEVHLVIVNSEFVEIMATTEFQGQPLSFMVAVPNATAMKILKCASRERIEN